MNNRENIHCTVIFHRLGPYHAARLLAASRALRLSTIELSAETNEYRWDKLQQTFSFRRATLVSTGDSRQVPAGVVRARLFDALDEFRPDCVAVPGWSDAGALAGLDWCVTRRRPAIMMTESTSRDERRVGWKEAIKKSVLDCCSAALAGGQAHAEYLAQLGVRRESISLGYDAVDNEYFSANADAARSQEQTHRTCHKIPAQYFLASARFLEKKNLARLMQAYARYRELVRNKTPGPRPPRSGPSDDGEPWDLVLLGDGPLGPSLQAQRSALGLESHVLMPGFKQYPELPIYYGLAKAFVHASATEQWGLVVNEAMASGLPVLVSQRCGCTPDLVREGVNGYVLQPEDKEQMAQRMVALSQLGEAERQQMGSHSRRIIAQWGPDRFARGLREAAGHSLDIGPARSNLWQRMLLRALMRRG